MTDPQPAHLADLILCGGCAAKYGAGPLHAALQGLTGKFPPEDYPDLLVGLSKADDAAVYRLNATQAVVQSLDFFPPIVSDPHTYGAIAAANAMNDIYAMGGEVLFALNIAAFPESLEMAAVQQILAGGADKVREAGGVIAGGHTITASETLYGLSVTGLAPPDRVRTNAAARPGDVVVLTKPIGTGVIIGAHNAGRARPEHTRAAIDQMLTLNRAAARATDSLAVHAMTDVTGFGLAGHLTEIAENSGVQIRLAAGKVPVLDGFFDYAEQGVRTGGQQRNRDFFAGKVTAPAPLTPRQEALMFDPQTCGGLLILLAPDEAARLEARLAAAGVGAWRIGTASSGHGLRLEP